MHFNDFPHELIQEIFGHLTTVVAPTGFEPTWCEQHIVPCVEVIYSSDERFAKRNLAACSLVCRHWNANATPLLFRTLALRFSPTSAAPRTLQDIAHWLVASGIRSFVQELRLILTQPEDGGDWVGSQWGEPLNYDAALLMEILYSFNYLRMLKLVDVRLDRFAQTGAALLGKRPKLNLDSFHYIFNKCSPFCGLQALPDLLYLMTWLGRVQDLEIGYVPLVSSEAHCTKGPVTGKGLQVDNANIEGDLSIHHLIRGLRNMLRVDFSRLNSLSVLLNVLGEDVLESIPPLFDLIAPHTNNLSINLIGLLNLAHGGIHSIPNSYTAFDLSPFTHLNCLRLDIPVGHDQLSSLSYEQLVWWYVANILTTAATLPELDAVSLVLHFHGPHTTLPTLLAACDSFATQIDTLVSAMPALKKFRLLKREVRVEDSEFEVVKGAFEMAAARGVLEYGQADDSLEVEHLSDIVPALGFTPWVSME